MLQGGPLIKIIPQDGRPDIEIGGGGGSGWIKLERGKCRFFSLQYIYEGARGKETAKSKEREASFLFLKKI